MQLTPSQQQQRDALEKGVRRAEDSLGLTRRAPASYEPGLETAPDAAHAPAPDKDPEERDLEARLRRLNKQLKWWAKRWQGGTHANLEQR
jgi:hypothetical protein